MSEKRKKSEILKAIYQENENIKRFSERGNFAQKEIDFLNAKIDELQRIITTKQKIIDESFSETENSSEKISRLFEELSNITVIPVKEPELVFENKFIYWNNKNNKIHAIGKTQTLLMLLWRNKKHRASLTKLEHVVWKHKEKGEKRIEEVKTERGIERVNVASTFIDPNKIMSHIHYINNKLEESSFPYKIVSVNDRSRKLKGYRLKIRKQLAKKTNKNQQNISDLIHKICSK